MLYTLVFHATFQRINMNIMLCIIYAHPHPRPHAAAPHKSLVILNLTEINPVAAFKINQK